MRPRIYAVIATGADPDLNAVGFPSHAPGQLLIFNDRTTLKDDVLELARKTSVKADSVCVFVGGGAIGKFVCEFSRGHKKR